MTANQEINILYSLAEGLKIKDAGLALLVESTSQQATSYDFFRTLATHVIPYIHKSKALQTLVKRWERKIRADKKERNALKEEALEEVTTAYNKLAKRLEGSELLTSIQGLKKSLDEAKGYLDGTLPVYMPSNFEMAASALASACNLLLANRQETLVLDLIELAHVNDKRVPPGIAKCHFDNAILKISKENQKWGWNFFDQPHVCWSYLRLLERCWNLESKDFEGEQLKSVTIEECERSRKRLELHGFWVEIQGVRNKRQKDTHFFTADRFSKYLEVICNEILSNQLGEGNDPSSVGIYALSLKMSEVSLLLLIESDGGRVKTPYILHTYNTESGPYLFMKGLITHPDKDWVPSDVEMQSGSTANLLDRAKITGALKNLFFKAGKRKGSYQLITTRIALKDLDISSQFAIRKQLADLKLSVYNPSGIKPPKEWTTR